jgi:hypothetical protein
MFMFDCQNKMFAIIKSLSTLSAQCLPKMSLDVEELDERFAAKLEVCV